MTPIKIDGVYYAFWTCVTGYCELHKTRSRHKVSLRTGDRREALAACAELREKLNGERARNALGLPAKVPTQSISLGDYFRAYFTSIAHDKAASTKVTERGHANNLLDYFGNETKLTELTQDKCEAYKAARLTRVVARSWNSELATLKSIFAWGLRRDPPLYDKQPFAGITRAEGPATKDKYISPDDLKRVLTVAPEFWRDVILFLYTTVCRGGELRGLTWDSVSLGDKDKLDGYIEFLDVKESGETKRVAMTEQLYDILTRAQIRKNVKSSKYVFPALGGDMMRKELLHKTLQRLGRQAKVRLSPHMLRHSGITDALRGGAQLFAVQSLAGHRQISTTQKYVHYDHKDQQGAMTVLAQLTSELNDELDGVICKNAEI